LPELVVSVSDDRLGPGGDQFAAVAALRTKRKGLQLALEPLDGRGIAGYVPEP
jgi:hypothetical protein